MTTITGGVFSRPLVILGFSEAVSNTGNWITMMAVFALLVFRGNGGVLESGGIMMAGLLPVLFASPFAGLLCDRYDRKMLMIASEVVSGLLVSVLIFTSNMLIIYPVLALQAASSSVLTPARRSSVPMLVSGEHLMRANAFFQQLSGLIKIGGPLLAGVLLAVLNPHSAIILDAVSFGISALLLCFLPPLKPAAAGSGRDSTLRDATSGDGRKSAKPRASLPSLILGSAPLRLIFSTAFLAIVVIVGFDILASVFVRDSLHAGERTFGFLVSMVGLGTVGVSAVIMMRRGERDPWADVITGVVLLSAIPLVCALSRFAGPHVLRISLVGAGCFLGGIGTGLINIAASTLLQRLVPGNCLGRVSGAFQSTAAAGQVVGVLATPLVVPSILTMDSFFLVAFCSLAGVVVFIAVSLRNVKTRSADLTLWQRSQ